jgi:hypothetical protein
MLKLHLYQIDAFDAAIASIDAEVDANVELFRAAIKMLSPIPGNLGFDVQISPLAAKSRVVSFPEAQFCSK